MNANDLLEGIIVDERETFGKKCVPSKKDGTVACAARQLDTNTGEIDEAIIIFAETPQGGWGKIDEYGKESVKAKLEESVKPLLPPSVRKR